MTDFRPIDMLTGRVSISKQDIEGAERVFHSLEKLADRPAAISRHLAPTIDQLLSLAQSLLAARTSRSGFFESELFGEAAWDMMLTLYCSDAAGRRITVSGLCSASGCPDTTALRWQDTLRELGLIKRIKNPLDGRVSFVELEPQALAQMSQYLTLIWTRYFPID